MQTFSLLGSALCGVDGANIWAGGEAALEVVARNNSLNDLIHSDGATLSRGNDSLGHQEFVAIKLAIGVWIWELLLHVYCANELEAPGHANVFPGESLLSVPDDELHARLR